MRDGITFTLSAAGRQRLSDIAAAPRSPQKHVWRARIVLLSGDGVGTSAIIALTPTHHLRHTSALSTINADYDSKASLDM